MPPSTAARITGGDDRVSATDPQVRRVARDAWAVTLENGVHFTVGAHRTGQEVSMHGSGPGARATPMSLLTAVLTAMEDYRDVEGARRIVEAAQHVVHDIDTVLRRDRRARWHDDGDVRMHAPGSAYTVGTIDDTERRHLQVVVKRLRRDIQDARVLLPCVVPDLPEPDDDDADAIAPE